MALNRVYAQTNNEMPQGVWTGPQARTSQIPKSGDPCVLGKIPGVAVEDFDSVTGIGVAQKDGIFTLSVKAESGAIALGDILYFDPDDATTSINNDSAGSNVRFGYALAAIGSGLTATIQVQVGY